MTEVDTEFGVLLSELRDLVLTKAPIAKTTIAILKRQDSYDIEEAEKRNEELDAMRARYSEICRQLLRLDKGRATAEISLSILTVCCNRG